MTDRNHLWHRQGNVRVQTIQYKPSCTD